MSLNHDKLGRPRLNQCPGQEPSQQRFNLREGVRQEEGQG